jgi:hypothetical protein
MTRLAYIPAGSSLAPPKKVGKVPDAPINAAQVLQFYGYRNQILQHSFQALCGPQPPQITNAPVDITVVNRPRSVGYTIATGYDPVTMDVQIRFENWIDYRNPINPDVEGDISQLLWMGGRGRLGPDPSHNGNGNPPIVKVRCFDPKGTDLPLIPVDYTGIEWVISNIQWDPTPLRLTRQMISARNLNLPVGTRGRQDATVTLTQWIPAPGDQTVAKSPDNGNFSENSDGQFWNVRLMTNRYLNQNSSDAYKAVMQLPANKALKLRNPGQRLPVGTRVYFPNSLRKEG